MIFFFFLGHIEMIITLIKASIVVQMQGKELLAKILNGDSLSNHLAFKWKLNSIKRKAVKTSA